MGFLIKIFLKLIVFSRRNFIDRKTVWIIMPSFIINSGKGLAEKS